MRAIAASSAVVLESIAAAPSLPRELKLEPLLLEFLGWNHLATTVIAAQLLELGKAHASVAPSSDLADDLNVALPHAYSRLAAAAGGSGPDRDAATTILHGARWLWTGGGFAASADVALDCSGDMRPYLHGVPAELAPHDGLLAALGVKPAFAAEGLQALRLEPEP